MATKVKLRQKAISGNRQSLYLDFYPPIPRPKTGKPTRREFLGLYLYEKTKNPLDKQSNKETLQLAENIKAKRQIEIQAGNYGFLNARNKAETNFAQYFKELIETKTGKQCAACCSRGMARDLMPTIDIMGLPLSYCRRPGLASWCGANCSARALVWPARLKLALLASLGRRTTMSSGSVCGAAPMSVGLPSH